MFSCSLHLQSFLSPFLPNQVLDIISKGGIKGIAHITGGGFTDNIPRVFPDGLGAVIHWNSWEVPTLFKWIQEVKMHFSLWILYDINVFICWLLQLLHMFLEKKN